MSVLLVESPVANIANIARALRASGADLTISADARMIAEARAIVLPGVGTFTAAMLWLNSSGVAEALRSAISSGASLLGICVGHQVLFERSSEMGTTPGLGLIAGSVESFTGTLPVPQIGWNRVTTTEDPLFDGVPDQTSFYFVHSYHAICAAERVIARSDYGGTFAAAVRRDRIWGVQFHPERSSVAGLRVLRNFVEERAGA